MWTAKGKFTRSTIETESFSELKALWRLRSATYNALCSRFDQEQRNVRGVVQNRPRSIADWHPVRNKLSEREEQWTQMQPQVLVTHACN
jgi:cellobiose-specific phosphotransferase system component IIA